MNWIPRIASSLRFAVAPRSPVRPPTGFPSPAGCTGVMTVMTGIIHKRVRARLDAVFMYRGPAAETTFDVLREARADEVLVRARALLHTGGSFYTLTTNGTQQRIMGERAEPCWSRMSGIGGDQSSRQPLWSTLSSHCVRPRSIQRTILVCILHNFSRSVRWYRLKNHEPLLNGSEAPAKHQSIPYVDK